jgi:hypothetical protein
MLRPFSVFLATTLFATAALAALTTGAPAPAFTGTDAISGKPVSLSELKGKTVVLEWNNFNCPFVQKFYAGGAMQAQQESAVKDGVVWITVNSSAEGKQGHLKDADAVKAAVAEHKIKSSAYILDHDGTIGKAYSAKTTPHMFVINTEGTLVYQGAIDSKSTANASDIAGATNYVSETLKALKGGTPVKTDTTQPYGCAVKY